MKPEVQNVFLPKSIYKELIVNSPICTVDVIFFNPSKDKTLLFKRVNKPFQGEYFSIGGRLLKNEEFIDGALRQGRLELSLDLDPEKLIFGGVINEIHNDSIFEGVNYHTVNIHFGYILDHVDYIVLDDQHSKYKWVDLDDNSLPTFLKERIGNLKNKI